MKRVSISAVAALTVLSASTLLAAAPKSAKSAGKEPAKPAPAAEPAKPAPAPAAAADDTAKPAPAKPDGAAPAPAAPAEKTELPASVATVNGQDIKGEELEQAFDSMVEQQGVPPDAVPKEQRGKLYHQVLDNLIVSKLLEKKSAEITIKDEEVAATLDRLKEKFGSEEELKKQVEAGGQTLDGLKDTIRASLRQQHWVDGQIKEKPAVTEADAETFYKENPDQFKEAEQVRASHILIAVPEDAKPEVVVEKEKTAQAVLKRIKGGEDFAKVAKEVSEDEGSKVNGGDLDFFTKDRMVPPFADAAFKLKKDEISEPVRSEFGYHIIKLTDRKAAVTTPLAEVKPQLIAFLEKQKKQDQIKKVLQDLRDSADVKVTLP